METVALFVSSILNAGTALALVSLGLLVNERAGVLNLGVEGLMLIGAISAFATGVHTGSDSLAFLAAAGAAVIASLFFGVLVLFLDANQYATGLALGLFGSGISAFAGVGYTGQPLGERPRVGIPGLEDLPFVGTAFFRQHPLVYLPVVLSVGITWFLFRTRSGRVLCAVGESPESAHALGFPVRAVRLAAVAFGGMLAGLGGAFISVVDTPLWVEGVTAGKGWIALALTTFATWRPSRVLLGAYLFGGVTILQFHLQGRGVQVASHLLSMLPYLATIAVLAVLSRDAGFLRANMPASLGKPFRPDS